MLFLFFMLGILFISYVTPILDTLASLILLAIEKKKMLYNEEINDINIKIQKKSSDTDVKVLGFSQEEEE